MNNSNTYSALEALLFAFGEPCEYARIAGCLELSEDEVRNIAIEWAEQYNDKSGGLEVILYADSIQLVTRREYSEHIKSLLQMKRSASLSKAALEVLAIIAYNQPVTRGYIEQIRGGIDCGSLLASLTEKELIEERGRLEVPGKPYLFGTTSGFLRVFGINSLLELPPIENFTAEKRDEQMQTDISDEETVIQP